MKKTIPFIAVALLLFTAFKAFTFYSQVKGNDFPIDTYLSDPTFLEGNTYSTNVSFSSIVSDSPESLLILARTTSNKDPLVLILPKALQTQITPNQAYSVDIQVAPNSLLIITSLEKK